MPLNVQVSPQYQGIVEPAGNPQHTTVNDLNENFASVSDIPSGFVGTARVGTDLYVGDGVNINKILPYSSPGLSGNFIDNVKRIPLVERLLFGTSTTSISSSDIKISDFTTLSNYYKPLEGAYGVGTTLPVSGTGITTIASSPQLFSPQFSSNTHLFGSDFIQLKTSINTGTFNSYLSGNAYPSANGMTFNAKGLTVTTLAADLNLVSSEVTAIGGVSAIEVGTCIVTPRGGLAVITQNNLTSYNTGNLVFEAVNCGLYTSATTSADNFRITFTKICFNGLASGTSIIDGVTTSVTLATPVASPVVVGMRCMWAPRFTSSGSYINDPSSGDQALITSISPDRLTVTFDGPLKSGFTSFNMSEAINLGGLIFLPSLYAGQMWSTRRYGPQRAGITAQAINVEVSFPSMPVVTTPIYTKTQIDPIIGNGLRLGMWPAVWLYHFRPDGTIATNREPWNEVDMIEVFLSVWQGTNYWSGALHEIPYTRKVSAIPNATWETTSASSVALTANTLYLRTPFNICDGNKHTISIIWDRTKITYYFDNIPMCMSEWEVSTDYPHQLGLNVACGSLQKSYLQRLMFPQNNTDALGMYMKVHKIETYEV